MSLCIKIFRICGVIAGTLADSPSDIVQISGDSLTKRNVAATTYQPPRALAIEGRTNIDLTKI